MGLERGVKGVHPRIRGEYLKAMKKYHECLGSPPHTRGILFVMRHADAVLGFTPAYAGNTSKRSDRAVSIWVHPRIRGEYYKELHD